MDLNSGAASPRVNRGAPHSGQKLRVARLPLPARTECVHTSDLYVRCQDNKAGGERSATGAKAVSAVADEHRDWRTHEHMADRSACAPAGERSSHDKVSSC